MEVVGELAIGVGKIERAIDLACPVPQCEPRVLKDDGQALGGSSLDVGLTVWLNVKVALVNHAPSLSLVSRGRTGVRS